MNGNGNGMGRKNEFNGKTTARKIGLAALIVVPGIILAGLVYLIVAVVRAVSFRRSAGDTEAARMGLTPLVRAYLRHPVQTDVSVAAAAIASGERTALSVMDGGVTKRGMQPSAPAAKGG